MTEKIKILDYKQLKQKVNRLSWQIFENNINEKNIVIVGCGAQGLNQGLNMRDSGLNISYALRDSAISSKRKSFINASSNNF